MMSLGGTQMRVAKLILLVLDGAEESMRYTPLMNRVLNMGATEHPFKATLKKLADKGFVDQTHQRGLYTINERGRSLLRALKERRSLWDLFRRYENRKTFSVKSA